MAQEPKKPYLFSLVTAWWIGLVFTLLSLMLQLIFFEFNLLYLFLIFVVGFVATFSIIQFRVQNFIYKRIRQIYHNVSLLSDFHIDEEPITTNMEELSQDIERFAENRKMKIEMLRMRENYRKEFIGNVSHELKTPLFTVEGYVLTLLENEDMDEERRKKYLERAHKGVERLIYIVDDLEMITKLESGNLNLKPTNFDLIKMISHVFEMLEIKAENKNITLLLDEIYKDPIWVKADKDRIQQVITNLVVNSIKYGKELGTTEINVEETNNNKYLIRITDNGEGFKKEDIPRLFERFFRIDKSGSRKAGGSGLGLSIVKHILEAHEEKIYVESDYGVGSEFSFTLPKGKKPKKK